MRTRKVGISIRERVDPLSPAADEGRNKGVLLRRDVVDLHTASEQLSIQQGRQSDITAEEGELITIWPLVRRGTLGLGWKGWCTPSRSPPRP